MQYVIAEDHASIALMIRQILESRLDVEPSQILEVRSSDELLQIVRRDRQRDYLVVLDMVMPGMYLRLALMRMLLKHAPKARVVAYTSYESPLLAAAILQHGGFGYVTKGSSVDVLVEAVRAAQGGQQYVDSNIDHTAIWGHPWLKLTESERAVVVGLCRGERLAAIATALGKTDSTVRTQKSDAMRKLGVHDDIDLMSFIHRHGLLFELDEWANV
jgi:DNA-binding NarL/FixJ family response regulator